MLMSHSNQTVQVLQVFAQLNFAGWQGLPEHATLADVVQLFPLNSDWTGAGRLGSDQDEHPYVYANIPGFETPVRVWLQDDEVTLMDVERPAAAGGLDVILRHIGAPDAAEDSYLGTLLLEKSEWIYASRGLTLFVNPENQTLLRLAIFCPSTLDHYLKHLRLNLEMSRKPQEVE
jgi:hypothetical protein